MKVCFHCGAEQSLEGRVGFRESCPRCGWELHICLNCRFHDREAHNQCREPRSEPVRDRDRGNYCDYFEYREGGREAESEALRKARDRAKKLFPF